MTNAQINDGLNAQGNSYVEALDALMQRAADYKSYFDGYDELTLEELAEQEKTAAEDDVLLSDSAVERLYDYIQQIKD